MATQLPGKIMPITQVVRKEKARVITAEEKRYNPYVALRQARANLRLQGEMGVCDTKLNSITVSGQ